MTIALAGTAAAPTWLVSVDDAAEPPTTVEAGATVATTLGGDITISGFAYIEGIVFNAGSSSSAAPFYLAAGTAQVFKNCELNQGGTSASGGIFVGSTSTNTSQLTLIDTKVKLAAAAGNIKLQGCLFEWYGGSVASGSVAATSGLINARETDHCIAYVSGVDLTEVGVTGFLVGKVASCSVNATFVNCKVPAWTTGGLETGAFQPGDRASMYNCDSSDTNYRLWIVDYFGEITSDTSVYNDAGADDGSAQGFSWKMVSSADAEFPHQTLVSDEIVKWNETTTGTLTATVEIVHNSQGSGTNGALRDDEIWLEVMCMDPGGTPIGKWQSDMCANLNLNSNAADQTSSSATWTGDSSGWDTQKLSVSFTPKEKGYVHARIRLAKASATVYVDPLLTIA
jgi:hypothetical protein